MPAHTVPAAAPVALITGAGSGIGRALALRLARDGYRLALVGRREESLRQTADLARAQPGAPPHDPAVLAADIADSAQAAAVVDATVSRFARLDALINNAGYAPLLSIENTTPEIIDRVYRTNAIGPACAIARAWPTFIRQRGGCIVNLSTMGTHDPFPGFFAYAAAKAAVNLMALSCAKEGAEHNIRAFAVAPGAVETPMLRSIFTEEQIPRSACLTPDDVAAVIADCIAGRRPADNGRVIFLASPQDATHISG